MINVENILSILFMQIDEMGIYKEFELSFYAILSISTVLYCIVCLLTVLYCTKS